MGALMLPMRVRADAPEAEATVEAAPEQDDPAAPQDGENIRRAKELAANGRALYAEGSYAAAIEAFRGAYELAADPNLLYNIALCHEKAGAFAEAADVLDRYRAVAPQAEREALRDKVEQLRRRAAEAAEPAAEPEPEPEPEPVPEPKPEPEPSRMEPLPLFNATAWTLLAVTVAGAATGPALGVVSLRHSRLATDACHAGDRTLCSATAQPELKSARGSAIGADVAFAVAAGCAVGLAVVLGLRAKKRRTERVQVDAGPLGVRGRF